MRCPDAPRSGMPSRSVKDCRVGRKKCALLAMTESVGFSEKRDSFQNETLEKRCGAAPRKNGRIKQKRPFPKQKRFKSVSLRGRSAAVAILKPKVWHPEPKHGSGKRQNPQISDRHGATPQRRVSGSAISRGRTPAFPVRSIFHTIKDRISRRSPAALRSGMPSRSVKDCRVGRKKCALLAMTNLIGFAGKRNGFQNETFEKRCGASPRGKTA